MWIQRRSKRPHQIAQWKFLQENGVESQKELDAFVELDQWQKSQNWARKEYFRPQPRPQPEPQPQPEPTATQLSVTLVELQPLPLNQNDLMATRRTLCSFAATPQASLEVKQCVRRARCSRKRSRENSSNTSGFAASVSFVAADLPNTGTGRKRHACCWESSGRPAKAKDDQKKEPKLQTNQL